MGRGAGITPGPDKGRQDLPPDFGLVPDPKSRGANCTPGPKGGQIVPPSSLSPDSVWGLSDSQDGGSV